MILVPIFIHIKPRTNKVATLLKCPIAVTRIKFPPSNYVTAGALQHLQRKPVTPS